MDYEEKYTRENNKIISRTEEDENIELIKNIIQAKIELQNANKNFEYAEGPLIDFYSYQIKTIQEKLDYLLKTVKDKGLVLDRKNEVKFRLHG